MMSDTSIDNNTQIDDKICHRFFLLYGTSQNRLFLKCDIVMRCVTSLQVVIGIWAYLFPAGAWTEAGKAKLRSVHVGLGLSTFAAGLATMAVSDCRKKERNPLHKGEADDIIGPSRV